MNREITNIRRGDIDGYNFDYMAAIMNITEPNGSANTHVGSMVRDMGFANHTSPIYEVDLGVGGKYHTSAHFDEATGDFVHHIRSVEESAVELAKRKAPMPYDSISWNKGGIDFIFCRHNRSAKLSGFLGVGIDNLFNIFWDQLTCENSPANFQAATHAKAEIYNEDLVVVGSLYMKPFAQKHVSLPKCFNNIPLALNQDCAIS